MKRDMEFVTPMSVTFEIDGRQLEITPIVVEEVAELLLVADPLFEELLLADDGMFMRLQAGAQTTADAVWLLRLVARHLKPVLEALVICSRCHKVAAGTPNEKTITGTEHSIWVRRLLPDRALELLTVCFQVNEDFFSRAFPQLAALLERFKPVEAPPADRASEDSTGETLSRP